MNHRSVLRYLNFLSQELFLFFLEIKLVEDFPDDKFSVVKDSKTSTDQEESQIANWGPNHVLELLVDIIGERLIKEVDDPESNQKGDNATYR